MHPEIPLDGDLRANIEHALFDTLHPSLDSYPETRLRERLRLVMADRALQRTYWSAHVTRRRESLAAALHAGVERGLLRRDLDVEATIDLLNGVFYYQYVVRGVSATRPDALARCRAAFDTVWRGIERGD
ncbi:TetR-like C-terminal domain-containing protein [Brevibacterium litoralis]|uniref:TetR-like C-terminal domain-containing protein n=1 Tax=Brevibacterium litoralis TaxID=3138935 RepID=UPI0032EF91EF